VGVGKSIHAGMVVVADGSDEMQTRLQRVLSNDPGLGIARHADAGYWEAIQMVYRKSINIPMLKFEKPEPALPARKSPAKKTVKV